MSGVPEPQNAAGSGARRRLVVDRWEGDLAVVEMEDGRMLELPHWLLPAGTREGDVIEVLSEAAGDDARRHQLRIDAAATARARSDAQAILARLRPRDPGGDIQL